MNKRIALVTAGIILVIICALVYVVRMPNKGMVEESVVSNTAQTQQSTPEQKQPTTSSGAYREYSETAVLETPGTKLLFFHAPWCPQCRDVEASINQDGLPDGVTVFKVDYDSNQKLRQRYGVTLQTTFVKIDDQGNKIASYVAYQEPNFSSVARELLP